MATQDKKKSRGSKSPSKPIDIARNSDAGLAALPHELKAKVRQMSVKNYGCVRDEITIDLDKIVVLVGTNNTGKSTVLRAYNLIMGADSQQKLSEQDMCDGTLSPEITLVTQVLSEHKPGERWIDKKTGNTIRERWIIEDKNKLALIRQGYDFETESFVKQVPYGAEGVAKWHRPKPHYISAFDSPDSYEEKIKELLNDIILDNIRSIKVQPISNGESASQISEHFTDIAMEIINQTKDRIASVVDSLRTNLEPLFPAYSVKFHTNYPNGEDMLSNFIKLLNKGVNLRFGHNEESFHVSLPKQGSGAQRMLMFAIVKYLAESRQNILTEKRSHILLLDEPEICLHPSVIREASRNLYDLANKENWQVILSTHSPIFLDLSRDNTTIVRLERASKASPIAGITVFRRDRIEMEDGNPAEQLKMINYCDSYATEFFFGGMTILVEGDTEYAVFKFLISQKPDLFRDIHIVRARGKDALRLLIKILNAFEARYSILHDTDRQKTKKGRSNPAFSANKRILETVQLHKDISKVFLIAAVPNFEQALFGRLTEGEDGKPYSAIETIRSQSHSYDKVTQLLKALAQQNEILLPKGCKHWSRLDQIHQGLADFDKVSVNEEFPLLNRLEVSKPA